MAPVRTDWGTSYDLTAGAIIDMDEAIYLTSPVDSPFLTGIDSDGLSVLSSLPTNQRRVDWQHDAILTPRSALAATCVTAATQITLGANETFKFEVNDVIRIENEHMLITAIDSSTVMTVTRGTDYGTAAQHGNTGNAATVIGVGHMLPEGSNPGQSRLTDRTGQYNVTQIFGPSQVSMSGTAQVVPRYGVPDEMAHQLWQRTQEITIRREQQLIYGARIAVDADERRTAGGILYYVSTLVNTTHTQLTVGNIQIQQQACYNAGGQPDRLAANPVALPDINEAADTSRVRMDVMSQVRGRAPAAVIYTEFGPLSIVRNRWFKPNDAVLWQRDQIVRRPMRPFQLKKLGITGDHDSMMMLCEESLEVKGEQHMTRWSGLAYTA